MTLAAVVGLAVGSFLNVLIHRVPAGLSVVRPGSRCPACEHSVRSRDNVPVLSWLLLRGRCRDCGTRIAARYPLVELGTALLFALVAARLGPSASLPAFLYLCAVSVALAAIDLETQRLPNVLTLPSYLVGGGLLAVAAAVDGDVGRLLRAVEGMVALYAFYFVICYATAGKGMGFGDVKLAGLLGLYLGWLGWPELLVGAFAAHLLGGVVAVWLLARGGASRKTRVPFGPFLVAGALVALLVGSPIAHAWLQTA